MASRGLINGKADKAADLPKFSETLTQRVLNVNPISTRGCTLCPPIGFASPKNFCDYAPGKKD